MRLAYCHANRLIVCLNKVETEIDCIEDDNKIKKRTDIDPPRSETIFDHVAASRPPYFSLPTTTFKFYNNFNKIFSSFALRNYINAATFALDDIL
jgi:hypothetical protein